MNKKETPQHHPATTDEAGENSVHDLNDDNDFGKCIIFLDQPFREKKKTVTVVLISLTQSQSVRS